VLRDLPAALHELAEAMKTLSGHEMAQAMQNLPTHVEHHVTLSPSLWVLAGFLIGALTLWMVQWKRTK
jgi:hypothetical protein